MLIMIDVPAVGLQFYNRTNTSIESIDWAGRLFVITLSSRHHHFFFFFARFFTSTVSVRYPRGILPVI